MSEVRREYVVDLSNVLIGSSEGLDCFAWLQGLPVLEQIIRCKECRFKARDGDWCYREAHEFAVEPNGFCAWAERRNV